MAPRVMRNKSLSRLAMTTALTGMAMFGYGRGAYAGVCDPVGGVGSSTYLCQGVVQPGDSTQSLSGSPLAVTTSEQFEINVTNGSAIELDGEGGITFDTPDDWEGYITGAVTGILATNEGGGNILITTTGGEVTGTDSIGIRFDNREGDAITVDSGNVSIITGDVNGSGSGIRVTNEVSFQDGDSNITINTTAGTVTSGAAGILVDQEAYSREGDLNVTVMTGDVTSDGTGIDVSTDAGTIFGDANVLIDTTDGTIDSGAAGIFGIFGIFGSSSEYGNANITIFTGDITSDSSGISMYNRSDVYSGNTNIEITTTGGTIQSTYTGINLRNRGETEYVGDSNVTITAGAIVAGSNDGINGDGIYVYQGAEVRYGDANVDIDATGPIEADGSGIEVDVYANAPEGTANVTITTGDVTAGDYAGIDVFSEAVAQYGSDIEINTTDGVVMAGPDGILVQNYAEPTLFTGLTAGGPRRA